MVYYVILYVLVNIALANEVMIKHEFKEEMSGLFEKIEKMVENIRRYQLSQDLLFFGQYW